MRPRDRLNRLTKASRPFGWFLALAAGVAAVISLAASLGGSHGGPTYTDTRPLDTREQGKPGGGARGGEGPDSSSILWAVGDGDARPESEKVVELIRTSGARRLLYLGDVYGSYARSYAPTWGTLRSFTWPSPGEEEWPTRYLAYWSRIRGQPMRPFASYRIGGWEILRLNSPLLRAGDTAQLDWLRRRLSEPGTCRIAFWHKPWQSASPYAAKGPSPAMFAFWQALAGRAVLVLNGDDHSMQQFRPVFGITQLTVGTGGHGLHPVRRDPVAGLAWAESRYYGALRIVLGKGRADFDFVNADGSGKVLHSGGVRCQPLPA